MSNLVDLIFGLVLAFILIWVILLQKETDELKKELQFSKIQIKIIDDRFYVEGDGNNSKNK